MRSMRRTSVQSAGTVNPSCIGLPVEPMPSVAPSTSPAAQPDGLGIVTLDAPDIGIVWVEVSRHAIGPPSPPPSGSKSILPHAARARTLALTAPRTPFTISRYLAATLTR